MDPDNPLAAGVSWPDLDAVTGGWGRGRVQSMMCMSIKDGHWPSD